MNTVEKRLENVEKLLAGKISKREWKAAKKALNISKQKKRANTTKELIKKAKEQAKEPHLNGSVRHSAAVGAETKKR